MSCAETLDVPDAPELDDILAAYANPSAKVSSALMVAAGDELLEFREQLEASRIAEQILDIIVSVQLELHENTDQDGELVVPGVGALPEPIGVIEIHHDCPGSEESSADVNAESSGSVQLNMLLDLGQIVPVVWGEAAQCQFSARVNQSTRPYAYDGELAVHFGEEPVSTGQSLRDLVITFVVSGTLRVEGRDLLIRRSFRLGGAQDLEILWELDDGTSFVYLFNREPLAQGVRDANGTFACSLEARQCNLPSGSFSW